MHRMVQDLALLEVRVAEGEKVVTVGLMRDAGVQ